MPTSTPHHTVNDDPCAFFEHKDERTFYLSLKDEDRWAFACLYKRIHNQFIPFAYQRGGDMTEILDILNDAVAIFLVKLRNNEYTFQNKAKVTTYLFQICYNQWHNYVDLRQRRQEVTFNPDWTTPSDVDENELPTSAIKPDTRGITTPTIYEIDMLQLPLSEEDFFELDEDEAEWIKKVLLLRNALTLLKQDCRNMLHWFYVDEDSLRDIANRLSITEGSAAVKRLRCATYLRDRYMRLKFKKSH